MRAMYTEHSSKRLIFPLPVSPDRQLGGLRSGEGIKGTTGPSRAQETAAVFADTHTVVLRSGGSIVGAHGRPVPDHPRSERKGRHVARGNGHGPVAFRGKLNLSSTSQPHHLLTHWGSNYRRRSL